MSEGITPPADVIIIGAGLSGLLALKKIVEEGNKINVEVYEANDRVGGRVCTQVKNGVKIDKGASWVGPTQTRMHELLNEFGIKTVPQYNTGKNQIRFNGYKNYLEQTFTVLCLLNLFSLFSLSLDISLTFLVLSFTSFFFYFKFICDRQVRMITKLFSGTIPPISIRGIIIFAITQFKLDYYASQINVESPENSPNAQYFDSITLLQWAEKQFGGQYSPAFKIFQCATDTIFGTDMANISFLHALFYIKSAGNFDLLINVKDGAQQNRIYGGSSELPLALYKKYSKYIKLSQPVSLVDNNYENLNVITFENGTTRSCKRVIIAVPPQVVSKTIKFTNLPAEKIKMLKAMQPGQLVKCFAVFKTPFWRAKGLSGSVLSPDEQPSLIYDVSNDEHGILLSFLIYTHAKLYRDLSFEMRQNYILTHYAKFFGENEVLEQFLFFDDDNFTNEKYSQGGPIGVFNINQWMQHGKYWKQPTNNIFWASTETSTIWNGYMEGAVRAGERAALEVIRSL